MKSLLPILADLANGIFAVVLAGSLTNTNVVWWYFLIGIPLAMSPDLDALSELWRRGRVSSSANNLHDHREGLHFPILFILIGVSIFYFASNFWGALFLLATTLHFINDLYGTGWGIKLFWPLINHNFKFASRRVNRGKSLLKETGDWESLLPAERRWRLVVVWKANELTRYIRRWGVDNWIDVCYLRLTWISVVEYSIFALSLLVLYKALV